VENRFITEENPIEKDHWIVWHSIRDDFHRIFIADFITNKELAQEYVNWKNKQ
jgi:hypothetical protein